MAIFFADEKTRLLICSIVIAFGSGFLIYSTYVTNNLQKVGEEWLNITYEKIYHVEPSQNTVTMLWAAVIAAKEIGKIIGTLLIPYLADTLGRRGGMLLNCLFTFIGCLLCGAGYFWPYHVIILGRIFLGISMICGVGLASLYLIEVAPMNWRGRTGSFIQIFRGFGGTLGMALALPELMGTPELWTLCLMVPLVPALVQFLVLLVSMESPRHLYITKGKTAEAAKAIEFYQGSQNVSTALEDLASEKLKIRKQSKIGLRRILCRKTFLRPILLTMLALTNRSLAGILPVQSYSTDMFVSAGVPHHFAAYSTVALGVCHLISAIVVTFTVEKYGRRNLLIGGNIGCLVTLLMVALCTAFSREHMGARVATVMFLALFMLVYPVVASVSNIVASEICHQKFRSYAFTFGLLLYSIVGFISAFIYPTLKHAVGLSCRVKRATKLSNFNSYIPFCLCLIFTIIIYSAYLPETKGKSFETIAFDWSATKDKMSQIPLLKDTSNFDDYATTDLATLDLIPNGKSIKNGEKQNLLNNDDTELSDDDFDAQI